MKKNLHKLKTLLLTGTLLVRLLAVNAQVNPSLLWQKSMGGTANEFMGKVLPTSDGGYLVAGSTTSPLNGDVSQTPYKPGSNDYWVVKTDSTGQKQWDRRYGSTWIELLYDAVPASDGGFVLTGTLQKSSGIASATDLHDVSRPDLTTNSSGDIWVLKIDINGNKVWDTRLGASTGGQTSRTIIATPDGGYLVAGGTNASTASLDVSQSTRGASDYWVVKLDANGQKVWDQRYGGSADESATSLLATTDGGYLIGGSSSSGAGFDKSDANRGNNDYWVIKIDANGNKLWDKTFGGSAADNLYSMVATPDGGYLLAGSSLSSAGFEKTFSPRGGSDFWIIKIDGNGTKQWDKVYGSSGNEVCYNSISAPGGGYYLTGSTASTTVGYEKTEASRGDIDVWVLKITETGLVKWDKTIGGTASDVASTIGTPLISRPDGGLVIGTTTRSSISGDKNENTRGEADFWIFKLGCAYTTETVDNTITPAFQTACLLGTPQVIVGTDDDGMYPDDIMYQWQRSNDGTSGWSDLPVGVTKDYLPEPASTTMYYRRIASWECHKDTSNVAMVTISSAAAPTLTLGGPFHSCPGTSVTLGGIPVATGGTAPYTYSWDNATYLNNASIANPVATVSASSVFTVTVTDAMGCKKMGQAIVTIPASAYAGPDVSYCKGGSGIQIGSAPLAGVTGVTYSWTPATGLSSTSIAQPIASPASTTTYTITITYPNSDGTTCTLTDDVVVTVAVPPAVSFAGSDVTICSGAETILGTTSVAGYTYTWSPGLYLVSNNVAQPTFRPGTPFPPVADPLTYTVTASNGLCTFSDQVVVTVIRANAGRDGCGPRMIGTLDLTPNVAETYSWQRLGTSTGTSNFTGATNMPMVPVSETSSGEDHYELTVSHGGTSCQSTVVVPPCGTCTVDFENEGGNCLIYRGTPLKLVADGGGTDGYTYSWSPADGLSTTNGPIVYLLDGVNRNYTVTKTRISNPSDVCTKTREVNHPAVSLPVYTAPDVTGCLGSTIMIGQEPVSGYIYSWTGPNGFSSSMATPTIVISNETLGEYIVQVNDTDPSNVGGCFTMDTLKVNLETVTAGGANWTVCENAIVKLGQSDPSNGSWTYSWTPSNASWQNGTGPTSAQPEVIVATTTTFNVTATNSTGCSATANVLVTVTNNPTLSDATDILNACPGSTATIGSPALPGVTYSWSPSTGLSNPNIAQPIVTVGTSGSSVTYTVTATFPGTCAATAVDQVTVSAFTTDFDLGADLEYCPSSGAINIGANAPTSNVSSYRWTPALGLSSPTIANPTTTVTVPTEYTLFVTYTNGCIGSDKIKVTPSSAPEGGLNKTICYGSNTLIGNASNTGTIVWSGTGSEYLSSTTVATPVFNSSGLAPAGSYTLTISQTVNGCTNTDPVTITVGTPVTVSSGSAVLCKGGTGTIGTTAVPGYTYSWLPATGLGSSASPGTTVTLSTAGTYTYVLQAQNTTTGCTGTANYTVTVLPTSGPEVVVPDLTACLATPATMGAQVSPIGDYSYHWSPATGLSDPYSANPSVTIATPVTYTLTVTDNVNGCATKATGLAKVDLLNSNYITSGPASSTACANGPVNLSVEVLAGTAYTYQWQKYNTSTSQWDDLTNSGVYSGVTTKTLAISNNLLLNGAKYRIIVSSTSCPSQQISSEATLTVNYCLTSSLGNFVWYDNDKDGTQDPDETGVSGVVVTLYKNGIEAGTTTTNSSGYYQFTNLDAFNQFGISNTYQVKFTAPSNYVFTTQGPSGGSNGAGSATDSDIDPETGFSRTVTLTYGEDLPDVDAGIHLSKELPVTLKGFSGQSEGCSIRLTWSVAEESRFSHYSIEFSENGKDFVKIGTVNPTGANSEYQFSPEVYSTRSYYRLMLKDLDGSISYSKIIVLNNKCQSPVTFNPNPATEYIQLAGITEVVRADVLNASGVIVKTRKNIKPDDRISVINLPEGIYFIKAQLPDGSVITKKLMIKK